MPAFPDGSILVPAESATTGSVLSPTDGSVLGTAATAGGELGDVLANGTFAIFRNKDALLIFSRDFATIATVTVGTMFSGLVAGQMTEFSTVRGNGSTKFYVAGNRTDNTTINATVRAVTIAGALGSSWDLPHATGKNYWPLPMAVALNDSILYYGNPSPNVTYPPSAIYAHDLVTNTDLGVFIAADATLGLGFDMFVLPDSKLLVAYTNNNINGSEDWVVRRYSAAGVLSDTYDLNLAAGNDGSEVRLAIDWKDPSIFWARSFNGAGNQSTFYKYRLDTGGLVTSFTTGAVTGSPATIPPVSCPFLILCSGSPTVSTVPGCPGASASPNHPSGCSCPPTPGTSPSGSPGDVPTPVDMTAWIPQCTGGGAVLSASDLTNSENWAT